MKLTSSCPVVSPGGGGGAQSFFPMNTGAPGSSASGQDAVMWVCSYCTLQNQPHTDVCEACSLPCQ